MRKTVMGVMGGILFLAVPACHKAEAQECSDFLVNRYIACSELFSSYNERDLRYMTTSEIEQRLAMAYICQDMLATMSPAESKACYDAAIKMLEVKP